MLLFKQIDMSFTVLLKPLRRPKVRTGLSERTLAALLILIVSWRNKDQIQIRTEKDKRSQERVVKRKHWREVSITIREEHHLHIINRFQPSEVCLPWSLPLYHSPCYLVLFVEGFSNSIVTTHSAYACSFVKTKHNVIRTLMSPHTRSSTPLLEVLQLAGNSTTPRAYLHS